jgi:hypothetical protein
MPQNIQQPEITSEGIDVFVANAQGLIIPILKGERVPIPIFMQTQVKKRGEKWLNHSDTFAGAQ